MTLCSRARLGWSLLALGAGLALGGAGCSNSQCDNDGLRGCADPNVIGRCTGNSEALVKEFHWVTEYDCSTVGRVCSETATGAKCVPTGEPDPVCADLVSPTRCNGTSEVICEEGYLSGTRQCKSCTEVDNGTECAGGLDSHCDSQSDCLDGLTCLEPVEGYDTYCSLACQANSDCHAEATSTLTGQGALGWNWQCLWGYCRQ
jgi:hypothetical protein